MSKNILLEEFTSPDNKGIYIVSNLINFMNMDNRSEFTRHVSIDNRSSSVARILYGANLNLGQCYNLNLR